MKAGMHASRWMGLAALSLTTAVATTARAEPVCSTPDEFNAAAAADDLVATSGTLTFTIQGLVLAGVEKHHLVLMSDGRASNATGGSCVGIDFKTWGDVALPQDLGTVKEELYNTCCVAADCEQCLDDRDGAVACETWAGPRPSDVVFTGPDQTCDVTISVTPEVFGYDVQCTPGVGFGFEEANRYQLAITEVQIPVADEATVTNASFCYEATTDPGNGGGGSQTAQIPVMEDVTASPAYPDMVYPMATDLALSTGDGEIYLKFSLEDVPGAITSATLHLHAANDPSANGDGGDVFVVTDDAWSEATLTWSSRPAPSGSAVGRVEGIEPNTWVSVDVGSAISAPDVYSFAIVPRRTDTNGAHFDSKEVGAAVAAYLEIEHDPSVDPGDGGASGSGGSDEAGGSEGEGADESAGGTASGDGTTSGFVSGGAPLDDGAQVGCGCRSPQRSPAPAMLLLLALGLLRRRAYSGSAP